MSSAGQTSWNWCSRRITMSFRRSSANPPNLCLLGWSLHARTEKEMNIRVTGAVWLVAILVGNPALAPSEPPARTVSVTARGQAGVVPDLAELRLGVLTQARQLADAKRE